MIHKQRMEELWWFLLILMVVTTQTIDFSRAWFKKVIK